MIGRSSGKAATLGKSSGDGKGIGGPGNAAEDHSGPVRAEPRHGVDGRIPGVLPPPRPLPTQVGFELCLRKAVGKVRCAGQDCRQPNIAQRRLANRDEMTTPNATLLTRRRPGIWAALPLLVLMLAAAGCAKREAGTPSPRGAADRVIYLATTGEAPGDKTPYVDVTGRHRLGVPAPALGLPRFRPAVTPVGEPRGARMVRLKGLYEAVRQRLSDRDDEVQFRQRSMVLHLGEFNKAVAGLRLSPGDPLPPYNDEFRKVMKEARDAMAALRADLIRLNGVLLRLDVNLRAAVTIQRSLGQVGAAGGKLQAALAKAVAASLKSGFALRRQARGRMASYVEWMTGQEQALEGMEKQVAARGSAPSGPATMRDLIHRKTVLNR